MSGPTRLKIDRGNVMRMQRLLHMRYKPSELAREINISVDTIYRSYLPAGAPCEIDQKGRTWIIGDQFASWVLDHVKTNQRHGPKTRMESGQAYCVGCNKVVVLLKPKVEKPNARGVANFTGRCPQCGRKVNRFCKAAEWQGISDQPR